MKNVKQKASIISLLKFVLWWKIDLGEIQSQDTERGVHAIVQNSISKEKIISHHAKDLFLFARGEI